MCITARCGCVETNVEINRPSWDDVYSLYNSTSDHFLPKTLNPLNGQISPLPESNTSLVFNALINAPRWKWSKLRSPIDDANVLKEWLSKCDVWGDRDNEIYIKNQDGLPEVRKMIGGRDGVCIIIRGTKTDTNLDQAVLWGGESEDVVGVMDTHIDNGDTVYFWALKGIIDSGENWIWSRGDMVFWMVGVYGDTEKIRRYEFKASSGLLVKDEYGNTVEDFRYSMHQCIKNGGPTVEGDYLLNLNPDPERTANTVVTTFGKELTERKEGGIERIPPIKRLNDSWGEERVKLEPKYVPQPEKVGYCKEDDSLQKKPDFCKKRHFDSFYFHDSHKTFTHGCTEVESMFFKILKKHRSKMKEMGKNMKINVLVKYPKEHSKKGHRTTWVKTS